EPARPVLEVERPESHDREKDERDPKHGPHPLDSGVAVPGSRLALPGNKTRRQYGRERVRIPAGRRHFDVQLSPGEIEGNVRRREQTWHAESPSDRTPCAQLESTDGAAGEKPGRRNLRRRRSHVDRHVPQRVGTIEQPLLILSELIADEGGE